MSKISDMAKIKSIIYIPGKYNLQTRTVTFFRSGNIAKKSRIYFTNDVSINFLFLILIIFFFFPRFFFLSTSLPFDFNLWTSSLLINFIITYHTWFVSLSDLLTTSICFQVSMLWMLVTMIRLNLHYGRHW